MVVTRNSPTAVQTPIDWSGKNKRITSADDTHQKANDDIFQCVRAWRVTRYNDATPKSPGYKAYTRGDNTRPISTWNCFYFYFIFQFYYGCRRDLLRLLLLLCCAVQFLSRPREIVIYLVYLLRCFFSFFFGGVLSLSFLIFCRARGRVNHSSLFCSVWVGGYVVYCVCVCVSSAKASADCVISLLSPYPSAPPFFFFLIFPFPFDSLILLLVFFFLGLDCLVSQCESKRPNHITLFSFIFFTIYLLMYAIFIFFEYFLRVLPVLCSRWFFSLVGDCIVQRPSSVRP